MKIARLVTSAVSLAALTATAHAAATSAQFYKGKLSGGATFVEEATWDAPGSPTSYKGNGKITLNGSASLDVDIIVVHNAVTVGSVQGRPPSSVITANFNSSGTATDTSGTETGSLNFGGGAGTGTGSIGVIDDFSPNGDNLSIALAFDEPMKGECKDSRNTTDPCNNPAAAGTPHIIDAPEPPLAGKFDVKPGGNFLAGDSSTQTNNDPSSPSWRGLVCRGSISSGWQCGFSGSRVYKVGTGYTYTEHVQMNAKISIVGKGKW